MSVKFSKEQLRAIETLDKSVLVSAAAGSGKTAVLVERILRIILDGKANVDEMLIVTFTRAAAAEMKSRLSSAIRKQIAESPDDAKRLSDQLARMYRAYITTIDSFAMRVIREFFYEIDMEPDFGACDEVQGELMRREALQELIDAGFEDDMFLAHGEDDPAGNVGFREFLRLYSEERQEDTFKDRMLSAYSGLRSVPDYFEWAYNRAELLKVTPDTFEGSELQAIMTEDAAETMTVACEAAERLRQLMHESGLDDLFSEKLLPEVSEMESILREVQTGGLRRELMDRMGSIGFISLRPGKAYKEAYEPIKDEVKALREAYKKEIGDWSNRYIVPDFNVRLEELNETYRYTIYYIRLLEEFERRYMEKKRERRVMDFADMEHFAVRILKKSEAAETLRRRFRYIFVDEYQDTNRIQEALISSIARPDNVFRVGDIKQSIYKFRQAEPSIFREVYRSFSGDDQTGGVAIDLSRNFRSNDATIRYVNTVFGRIMEDYDERARLNTGTECPPEYDFVPEVHILTEEGSDEEGTSGTEEPEMSVQMAADIDDEITDISKEEAEAAYIADLAAGLLGTEFYDTKRREVRLVESRDIVILFRAVKTRGDIMARALRKRGLDPFVEETDDYFDTVEIGIALSLLSCIDNMKRDVPLIASLHSEAFGWTAEELAEIRIAHSEHRRKARAAEQSGEDGGRTENKAGIRPAYWEALKWYREEGPEGRLRDKAAYAAERILEWRRLSHMMPLDDFVWHVLTDSGYYRMAGAMNGGSRRQANLRALADRAGSYSRDTVASLSSFITFVDVMRQKGISNGQVPAAGPGDDVIRISTIHKSKGLEYPFVIVGGLGHRIRYDSIGKSFSFDTDIGVALPYIDPSRKYWRSTIVQRAINSKSHRDSYSEELRVLYVAMTRARNKLILVGTCRNEEELDKYYARPSDFLKVMRNVIRTGDNTYHVQPLERSGETLRTQRRSIPDPAEIVLTAEEEKLYREIDRRFTYEYPYNDLLTAKAKYSVSALRRETLEAERTEGTAADGMETRQSDDEVVILRRADEQHRKASAADIGIAYHRIMEFVDFARAAGPDGVDEDYIRERACFLADNGAIEPDVFKSVDIDRIADFFRTDIGNRAAKAARRGTLKKEKAFTLRTAYRGKGSEDAGRQILVQGVIDCCFEENGRMILIDYKSNYIRGGAGHEPELERIRREYKVQTDLYREAIIKGTGLDVSEAYLYLFHTGEALKML